MATALNEHEIQEEVTPGTIDVTKIDVTKLAGELGILGSHTFPDAEKKFQEAREIIYKLCTTLLPKMVGLTRETIGDFLIEHEAEIMRIFERYKDMWRFTMYMPHDMELRNPMLQDKNNLSNLLGSRPEEN